MKPPASIVQRRLAMDVRRKFEARTADIECPRCFKWERAGSTRCRWCGFEPGQGRTIGSYVSSAGVVVALVVVLVLSSVVAGLLALAGWLP